MARQPTRQRNPDGQTKVVTVLPDGTMTVRDAADAIGITAQTIRNWIEAGAPHIAGGQGRTNPARVRIRDLIAWREAQALEEAGLADGETYHEGRAKAMDWHYRAIKRRADACREIGTLIPVDLIADVWDDQNQRVRSSLMPIGSRLSITVAAETDPAAVKRMIDDEISAAMTTISSAAAAIEKAGGNPHASIHDHLDLDDDDPVDGEDDYDDDA
ncbi:helix-turn-helix domain-containing protein [Paracoccus sp. MA]|uniref:helix-turn-helix domain-containing protein n=1 Tax=Paracoccus sp. MA TaxID=2895796 RepID=UPI001E2DBF11|nr:helix-turn-helix domain-containing protein [Paracoccus sp. MA]UFM66786.1 helix-turn-helix domain-containing protein [Paracoccus sp. MA]